jgi:hypothetical protein
MCDSVSECTRTMTREPHLVITSRTSPHKSGTSCWSDPPCFGMLIKPVTQNVGMTYLIKVAKFEVWRVVMVTASDHG